MVGYIYRSSHARPATLPMSQTSEIAGLGEEDAYIYLYKIPPSNVWQKIMISRLLSFTKKMIPPTPPDYSHSSPLSDKLWTVTTKYRFSVCQNRIEPVVCIVVQQVETILTIYYV